MNSQKAYIADMFASLQGEGLYVGQKQVFIRFPGCNLSCAYCDEPAAKSAGGVGMTAAETARKASEMAAQNGAKDVSLTGGEPLLHSAFLAELMPLLKRSGLTIHLETNATLPLAYKMLDSEVDVVAADIKLPSSTGVETWDKHFDFISACPQKVFVKTVVTSGTKPAEFSRAVQLVSRISGKIPFFIQPATAGRTAQPPSEQALEAMKAEAKSVLSDVRVLAQQHPLWGIK